MFILILSNTLAVFSSYLITRRLFNRISFTDFLLSCFSLFLAQIVLIGLFLGIMGKLFMPNIILLEFVILLVSFSACSIEKAASCIL